MQDENRSAEMGGPDAGYTNQDQASTRLGDGTGVTDDAPETPTAQPDVQEQIDPEEDTENLLTAGPTQDPQWMRFRVVECALASFGQGAPPSDSLLTKRIRLLDGYINTGNITHSSDEA